MTFFKRFFKKEKKEIDREEREVKQPEEKRVYGKTVAILPGILIHPQVTEKTSLAAKENKYVFAISSRANKAEVKRAVEGRFGVKVASVNISRTPGKKRRRGRQIGWKPGFKKAVVTLREGESIEIQ